MHSVEYIIKYHNSCEEGGQWEEIERMLTDTSDSDWVWLKEQPKERILKF